MQNLVICASPFFNKYSCADHWIFLVNWAEWMGKSGVICTSCLTVTQITLDCLVIWKRRTVKIWSDLCVAFAAEIAVQITYKKKLWCSNNSKHWSRSHPRPEHFDNSSSKNRASDVLEMSSIYLLKREVLGGGVLVQVWKRIRRIRRSNFDRLRNDFYTNSIRSRAERLENFDQNRAPVRSVLKILRKTAFPCGAS